MKLSIGLLIIIILTGCKIIGISKNNNITAINYISSLPMVIGECELFNFGDTTTIFYRKDVILLKLPYTFDSSKLTYHVKADTIEQTNILTEKRYNYFIYRKGNKYGLWMKDLYEVDYKKMDVDSLLKKRVNPPDNLHLIVLNQNNSRKETFVNRDDHIVKYVTIAKLDETYNDTTFLHYSKKMNSMSFSLSPILDSLLGGKVYKVRIAFNEYYSPKYSIVMPARDILYEVKQLKGLNLKSINSLFKNFEKSEKKLLL